RQPLHHLVRQPWNSLEREVPWNSASFRLPRPLDFRLLSSEVSSVFDGHFHARDIDGGIPRINRKSQQPVLTRCLLGHHVGEAHLRLTKELRCRNAIAVAAANQD